MNTIKKFLQVRLLLVKSSSSKLLRILIVVIFLYFIGYKYFYQKKLWGFGEDTNKSVTIEEVINPKNGKIIKLKKETEQFQSAKTLWDWLELAGTLAIPLVLYLFQASEQRRAEERAKIEKKQAEDLAEIEKDIAENNLQEQALEAYIDRMAEIFINQASRTELFSNKDTDKDNSVRDVARIRTVTILRRLENDIKRQNRILHFLHDSEVLEFLLQNANFANINLKGFNFSGINLTGAIFREANLTGAKFNNCKLHRTNFSNAKLNGADFTNAKLFSANFSNANLNSVNFQDLYIQDIDFTNADLSNANLRNCKTWDDEETDANFEYVYGESDEFEQFHTYQRVYNTNFSGVKLINTNLAYCNFKGVTNLTVEQLKEAKNWDDAIYKKELFKELELPETFMFIIDTMDKNGELDDDTNLNIFIGCNVEIREYIDNERKTIIKGKITTITKLPFRSKPFLEIKTSDGTILDKVNPYNVYVFINTLKN